MVTCLTKRGDRWRNEEWELRSISPTSLSMAHSGWAKLTWSPEAEDDSGPGMTHPCCGSHSVQADRTGKATEVTRLLGSAFWAPVCDQGLIILSPLGAAWPLVTCLEGAGLCLSLDVFWDALLIGRTRRSKSCIDLRAFINREHYPRTRATGPLKSALSAVKHGPAPASVAGSAPSAHTSFLALVAFFIERQNKELRTKIITSLAIFHKMLCFRT